MIKSKKELQYQGLSQHCFIEHAHSETGQHQSSTSRRIVQERQKSDVGVSESE